MGNREARPAVNQGDTLLRCKACGHEQWVVFAHCLRQGWPRHCQQSMYQVETHADVPLVMGEALASAVRLLYGSRE